MNNLSISLAGSPIVLAHVILTIFEFLRTLTLLNVTNVFPFYQEIFLSWHSGH